MLFTDSINGGNDIDLNVLSNDLANTVPVLCPSISIDMSAGTKRSVRALCNKFSLNTIYVKKNKTTKFGLFFSVPKKRLMTESDDP